MTSGRLQKAQRTSGAPAVDVVVEDLVRDRDDPGDLGQGAAELHAVGEAERTDVGGGEVRALRHEHLEPERRQAVAELVSLRLHLRDEGREVRVVEPERLGDRGLERRARTCR